MRVGGVEGGGKGHRWKGEETRQLVVSPSNGEGATPVSPPLAAVGLEDSIQLVLDRWVRGGEGRKKWGGWEERRVGAGASCGAGGLDPTGAGQVRRG